MTDQHPLTDEMINPDPLTVEYLRPDYQAAYSQLARKFTILERTLDDSEKVGDFWNAPHDADRVIYEAMELIQAVEKAELTVQVIQEDNS